MWTFSSYLCIDGRDLVRSWYDTCSPAIQAEVDVTIDVLKRSKKEWWRRKQYARLQRGPCIGLEELIICVDRVHYRIFGYEIPGRMEFVLLWAFQKDNDPRYVIGCPIAQKHKIEIENDPTRTASWEA